MRNSSAVAAEQAGDLLGMLNSSLMSTQNSPAQDALKKRMNTHMPTSSGGMAPAAAAAVTAVMLSAQPADPQISSGRLPSRSTSARPAGK